MPTSGRRRVQLDEGDFRDLVAGRVVTRRLDGERLEVSLDDIDLGRLIDAIDELLPYPQRLMLVV